MSATGETDIDNTGGRFNVMPCRKNCGGTVLRIISVAESLYREGTRTIRKFSKQVVVSRETAKVLSNRKNSQSEETDKINSLNEIHQLD